MHQKELVLVYVIRLIKDFDLKILNVNMKKEMSTRNELKLSHKLAIVYWVLERST